MTTIRGIPVPAVQQAATQLLKEAAHKLPPDYLAALRRARQREPSAVGQSVLEVLLDNARYADAEQIPTCQDTGMVIFYLEVGQNVHFSGGDINRALHRAVADAYRSLRKSVVTDPLQRTNSGDNTPPIIHYTLVPGDRVRLTALMKGFGAELMSRLQMFPPSVGVQGVKEFVLKTVEQAGPNACPPVIVGVGLGSSFDGVGQLAKKALLRPLGQSNPLPHLAQLEADLLAGINQLGIGPQGLGGRFTALAVHVESFPTHIAALPAAVNLNCSAPRRATTIL